MHLDHTQGVAFCLLGRHHGFHILPNLVHARVPVRHASVAPVQRRRQQQRTASALGDDHPDYHPWLNQSQDAYVVLDLAQRSVDQDRELSTSRPLEHIQGEMDEWSRPSSVARWLAVLAELAWGRPALYF